jgi:transcriptional regulator with XRE-family HTH domain
MPLGEWVKAERLRKGWSLRELEKRSGMSRTAIDNLEKGEDVMPTLPNMEGLAKAFQVPPWEIMVRAGVDPGVLVSQGEPDWMLTAYILRQTGYDGQPLMGEEADALVANIKALITATKDRQRKGSAS